MGEDEEMFKCLPQFAQCLNFVFASLPVRQSEGSWHKYRNRLCTTQISKSSFSAHVAVQSNTAKATIMYEKLV